jgi:hypothetical protein
MRCDNKRMRLALAATLLAVISVGAACSSTYSGLPYKPEAPTAGAPISAAYTVVSDRLRVEIDTGGRRLERAQIVKADGAVLEAQTIEYAAPSGAVGSPVGIGIGIGTFGGLGRGVGTGVGVSTGGVVGGGGSSAVAATIASYPLDQAGPRPWRVRVKLDGLEPTDIVVGEPEGSAKPAPR